MIANDMRRYFKDFYDGASLVEMGYDDGEVGRFLTAAQYLELERRLFANRNPQLEGYEIGMLRDNEFAELKNHVYIYNDPTHNRSIIVDDANNKTYVEEWTIGIFPNSLIIELPTDFMFYSSDYVDITHNERKLTLRSVKSLNEDNVIETLNNVFLKPNNKVIYRLTYPRLLSGYNNSDDRTSRRCQLITDEHTTIDRYVLSYLREPRDIIVDTLNPDNQQHCELNDSFHLAIVRRAVSLALGSIESTKYQVSLTEKTIND